MQYGILNNQNKVPRIHSPSSSNQFLTLNRSKSSRNKIRVRTPSKGKLAMFFEKSPKQLLTVQGKHMTPPKYQSQTLIQYYSISDSRKQKLPQQSLKMMSLSNSLYYNQNPTNKDSLKQSKISIYSTQYCFPLKTVKSKSLRPRTPPFILRRNFQNKNLNLQFTFGGH